MSIKQGHIDALQAVLLLWLTISGKALLGYSPVLMAEGFSASWMIPVGSGLLTAAALLPGVALMRRFPGRSFARAGEEAVGPLAGKAVGLAVTLFILLDTALTLRQFSDAFNITVLPLTPTLVLTLVLALTAGFAAYTGLEAFGRISIFLVPWFILFLFATYTGRPSDLILDRLMPFWGPGPRALSLDLFLHTGLYSEIIILLVLFPYLRKPETGRAVGFWAVGLAAFILTAVQIVLTITLDVLGTERLLFPVVHLARLVTLGRFEVRPEPIVVLLWMIIAAFKVTVLLWGAATHLGETLRLESFKPLLPVVIVLAIAGSGLTGGVLETINLYHLYILNNGWTVLVPAFLWLAAVVRKRRPE